VLGAIQLINKTDGAPFSVVDRDFLTAIEDSISGALAAVQAKETAEHKVQQSVTLAEICHKLTTGIGSQPPLQHIVGELKRVMDVEETAIFVRTDDERPHELFKVTHNAEGHVKEDWVDTKIGKSIVLQCYQNGQVYNIDDAKACAFFNRRVDRSSVGDVNTSTVLAMPYCNADGKILGVLQAVNKRMNRLFLPEDEQAMAMFAKIANTAITNSLEYGTICKEHDRSTILVQALHKMSGSLDLARANSDVLSAVKELTKCDQVFLFLREKKASGIEELCLVASTNDTRIEHIINLSHTKGLGFPGHACAQKELIHLSGEKIAADPRYSGVVDSIVGYAPSGLITVPIPVPGLSGTDYRGPALGAIQVVNSSATGRPFSAQDASGLQSIAGIIAVTIMNAQSHAKSFEEIEGTRSLMKRLEASRPLLFELEAEDMRRHLCTLIKELLGAKQVSIYAVDPETAHLDKSDQSMVRVALNEEVWPRGEEMLLAETPVGKGFVGECVVNRSILVAENVLEDDRSNDAIDMPVDGSFTFAVLCAPCFDSNNDVNGVIHVIHSSDKFGKGKHFSSSDHEFVSCLGVTAGTCISNSDRYTELRELKDLSLAASACEHRLSVGLCQSPIEKFPLAVITQLTELFSADAVFLYIHQEDKSCLLRYGVDPGKKQRLEEVKTLPIWGVAGEVVNTARSARVASVLEFRKRGQDVFDVEIDCPAAHLKSPRSMMCAPIMKPVPGDVVSGAISVVLDTHNGKKFNSADQSVLEQLCAHLAGLLFTSERLDALIPDQDHFQKMFELADFDGSSSLDSEAELFVMAKQLCMKFGVPGSSRDTVTDHVKKALKVKKAWKLNPFVEWFESSMEQHYNFIRPTTPNNE